MSNHVSSIIYRTSYRFRSVAFILVLNLMPVSVSYCQDFQALWVENQSTFVVGQPFDIMLLISNYNNEDSIELRLDAPNYIEISYYQKPFNQQILADGMLLRFSVSSDKSQSFRITALFREKKSNKVIKTLSSSYFEEVPQSRWLSYLPNLITTILAFAAGAFTMILQKIIDNSSKKRLAKKEAESAFIKFLSTELASHQVELLSLVEGKKPTTRIFALQTVKYNSLLGKDGYTNYLDSETRKRFFKKVKTYYESEVNKYNLSVHDYGELDLEQKESEYSEMTKRAQDMIDHLKKLQIED